MRACSEAAGMDVLAVMMQNLLTQNHALCRENRKLMVQV
jgi:hypothetical protein